MGGFTHHKVHTHKGGGATRLAAIPIGDAGHVNGPHGAYHARLKPDFGLAIPTCPVGEFASLAGDLVAYVDEAFGNPVTTH
jgi:hypothetical protein